jgi:hypothetical protein
MVAHSLARIRGSRKLLQGATVAGYLAASSRRICSTNWALTLNSRRRNFSRSGVTAGISPRSPAGPAHSRPNRIGRLASPSGRGATRSRRGAGEASLASAPEPVSGLAITTRCCEDLALVHADVVEQILTDFAQRRGLNRRSGETMRRVGGPVRKLHADLRLASRQPPVRPLRPPTDQMEDNAQRHGCQVSLASPSEPPVDITSMTDAANDG